MTGQNQFSNFAPIHSTKLHLDADGIPYSEYALRAAVKSGAIPATMCGRKAMLWYENVLQYIREGDARQAQPIEVGKIRPIRA